ncbi:MAG TPA: peptidylprolyl isomerase [Bacteroidia bacterium]|jgi:peptidylprolyl isomerase|nr:peptidylprolyl isomerase [Bacteroidia bacterium]
MKRIVFFILSLGLFSTIMAGKDGGNKGKEEQTKVLIHTDLGDIKVVLYNETPKHRDNFIKLVKEGTINNTIFHRVIEGFMIQGGDPDSKNAPPGTMLGNGNVGYTIPAEIDPRFFHKKGALAAARLGDEVNPNKESSGCQFYIVHGRTYSDTLLSMEEMQMNQGKLQQIFSEYVSKPENRAFRDKFIRLQTERKMDSLQIMTMQIDPFLRQELTKRNPVKFTPEQRKAYSTLGGAPHLDGGYTVFGEVYEGLDVVDKIATAEKDQFDRPKTDIHMTLSIIK